MYLKFPKSAGLNIFTVAAHDKGNITSLINDPFIYPFDVRYYFFPCILMLSIIHLDAMPSNTLYRITRRIRLQTPTASLSRFSLDRILF